MTTVLSLEIFLRIPRDFSLLVGRTGIQGKFLGDYYSGEAEISVQSLIEAQRKLSISRNHFERVVGSLFVAGLLQERLSALSDHELGQLMFDYVSDDMNVFSPELAICQVATERLLGRPVQTDENNKLGGY